MSFIVPSGWTRHQGFPKITGNEDGATLTDEFYADYNLTDIFGKLPDNGSLYDPENISPELVALRLNTYSIVPTATKNNAIITLTYQPSTSSIGIEEGIADYFMENTGLEKALETATNPFQPTSYLTRWNYHLCKLDGTAESKPASWDSATNTKLSETEWKWVKEASELPDDWVIVEAKTKQGIESYIYPAPVVQERKFYGSKKSASTAAAQVGKRVTPGETFGFTGGEWLIVSASIQKDGRKYLVERSFQYADDWDSDLYATP